MVKSEVIMSEETRPRYTDEYKMEAVRLGRESGRPAAQMARELGIAENLLLVNVANGDLRLYPFYASK